jgi:two-component system, OmpR family, response regulator MprA
MAASKILVIEDEVNIADFVKRGLVHSGFDCRVAATGAQGVEIAASFRPDLVVLDLMLPDLDGLDVCRSLRAGGDVGIVILTARHLVGDRVHGLDAVADDYLPKPLAFEELLARIRAVLRRRAATAEGVIRVGSLELDIDKRQATRNGRQIELTTREFELLKLFAENAGKPLRREFILQRVWGWDFEGETDPLKVYMNYLRRKLNAGGEPDMVQTLRGFGYALRAEAAA